MTDIRTRVLKERRGLSALAHERWRASQPVLTPARATVARRARVPLSVGTMTPEQSMNFAERQRLRGVFTSTAYRGLRVAAERQIGATLDFVDLPPDERARKAGRPVARLVTLPGPGLVPMGFATGFLVAPGLLLTNHHVFRTRDEAREAGAQFLHERTAGGLHEGVTFALDPDRFFINHKGFDYAVVAVKTAALDGTPLQGFPFLPLAGVTGKIRKGDPVSIIQHPEGGPKQYATTNNRLLDLREDGFLLYETDTLEGSSGSPVFSPNWETIGLHHCGVPMMRDGRLVTRAGRLLAPDAEVEDADLIWVANEGVRVSALVASFAEQRLDAPEHARILRDLVRSTRDPLRLVVEESPIAVGDARVATGAATAADADDPKEDDMARYRFTFSGPVTIHVGAATAGAGAAVEGAPVQPDGSGALEKALRFDEDYKGRSKRGYKPGFLTGWRIPAPRLNRDHHGAPLTSSGKKPWVIPYHHYSLVMNRDRRLLSWAASNVDYSDAARKHTKTRAEYGGENWRLDPRVALKAPGLQIEDAHFYKPATRIDRGHIVRREDGCWGATAKEAEYGNSDTYHWTNCTPQSEGFNQSKEKGIWGKFENHIQKQVGAIGGRMVVFAGPVLDPDDPERGYAEGASIQVPMEFWKAVLCVAREGAKRVRLAYGFVFDQTDPIRQRGYEAMDMDDYQVFQMPLRDITRKTGVVFDKSVLAADVMKGGGAPERVRGFQGKRITTPEEIVLR